MREFTILFQYEGKKHKASVLRSHNKQIKEYNVRPETPYLVRKFGHQIKIFCEKDNYTIQNHLGGAHKAFLHALVEAIHSFEYEEFKDKIDIKSDNAKVEKDRNSPENKSLNYPHSPNKENCYEAEE